MRVQEPRPRGGLVVAAGVRRCGREVAGDLRWQGDEPLDLAQRRRRQAGQRGRGARVGEAGAEQLDDRGVRDRALGGEGAGREDAAARGRDRLGQRLREPRLADPRLAGEHGDAAAQATPRRWAATSAASSASRPTMGRRAGRTGRAATSVAAAAAGRSTAAAGEIEARSLAAAGGHLGVPDRLVQVRRLGQRRDAQLALEDGDPGPVLADGAGPVAGPCEQGHQLAPGRFVERIEVEPARRGGDRAGQVPVGLGRRRQPLEHVPDQSLDGDRARRAPIVEVRAVAEREAGQERAARQRRPPGAGPRGRPTRRRPRDPRDRRGRRRRRGRRPSGPATTQRPPSAERRTDSVRRRALRADSSSDSGHSIAASSSRA